MTPGASMANGLWIATSLPAARRYAHALADPREAQERLWRQMIERHAASAFGQQHNFSSLKSPEDYARAVPVSTYDDVEPWVQRVRSGETNLLVCDRITHLAPTSGSTGAAKAIPFSPSLQQGFGAAVRAWMVDLVRQRPAILGGPAYWSISPVETASDTVFADDAEYLGGASAWLVRRALAVPSEVRFVQDRAAFWRLTLLSLLRCRDLRLISVWHPSFIDLLVAEAGVAWHDLVDAIASGACPWESHLPADRRPAWRRRPDPERANELRRMGPADWAHWWPMLQVVSCWGEQAAQSGWQRLVRQLPGVLVQAKGLLATEGVVTIPWRGQTPLAITSHYFEFISDQGDIVGAHELERDKSYEVLLTNGGGLWRYRLGDMVTCTGHVGETPVLRFIGRAGHVSDLRGEKLSESFVATVLEQTWGELSRPSYAALRPHDSVTSAGYELVVSNDWSFLSDSVLADRVDRALTANPHYAIARQLGQLQPVRVVRVRSDMAAELLRDTSGRLGDAKPQVLVRTSSADVGTRTARVTQIDTD